MNRIKNLKKIIFSLVLIGMFIFSPKVNALDNEYGIYCAYGDYYFMFTGSHRDSFFNLDTNFNELGIAIEVDRPGESFSNSSEREWFESKGIINSSGDFVCPDNPFGTQLGSATFKECGTEGCHVVDIATPYESYSCSYISHTSMSSLRISYTSNEQYVNGKWDIIYPDGSTATYIGTEINGNFMPGSDCNDIYYIASEKKIKVAINSNDQITNNATLSGLCDSYQESDIEHFCSGACTYEEMSCPNSENYGECPEELRPIIWFIKKLVFNTLQILVPILLIIMGTIDLVKAMISMDDKGNKEAISKFIRRVLSALLVFFIVTIVSVVMGMFAKTDIGDKSDWKACWYNID